MAAYTARQISVNTRRPNCWRNFTSTRLADMLVMKNAAGSHCISHA